MASPQSGIAAPIDVINEDLRQCGIAAPIDVISEDLLQNIVSRLPATSFASAACVSRSWNLVCDRVLSRPKLASACSFNHSLQDAVEEVVNKVLSQPIRPHFAIASIAGFYDRFDDVVYALAKACDLITAKLGSQVPVITNSSSGIIGRDAFSDEFKEFDIDFGEEDEDTDAPHSAIMLIVGFVPGLKVTTIPLLPLPGESKSLMIRKFVTDIREFSTSVSGCNSPAAIIMYCDYRLEGMMGVVEKMDHAMSPETVIVGHQQCQFQYTNITHGKTAAVALVFAVERIKPPGIGETQFHVVLSNGLSPVGPTYKATASAYIYNSFCISARREGSGENIDGRTILNQVYDELGYQIPDHELYIGVTKTRKCSFGQEKVGCMTFLAFYSFFGIQRGYLSVIEEGMKTGDTFRFYQPDSTIGVSSIAAVSSHLRSFNKGSNSTNGGDKQEVIGGLIFSGCGEYFFGKANIDSSPFLGNFPGVTLGGIFCSRVIGRGVLIPYVKESHEQKAVQCCMHTNGVVYLIMSYEKDCVGV